MTNLSEAYSALSGGRLDEARSLFLSLYDSSPGASALGLARVSLSKGDPQRAENLARTAIENGEMVGVAVLAEAIGDQGRRAEAAEIARSAMSQLPHSAYLQMVLGEQLIRQGDWRDGGYHVAEGLSLDRVGEVDAYLEKLLADLSRGFAAGKVTAKQAIGFVNQVENVAERAYPRQLVALAREALAAGNPMGDAPPLPVASDGGSALRPPPPPLVTGPRPTGYEGAANVPALVAVMRRDRDLNQELQNLLGKLGNPVWPSERGTALDPIPILRPERLGFDDAALRQNTLALTEGDVGSEILVERAQQQLLRAVRNRGVQPPTADEVGLTQLEIAMWYGALDEMESVPAIYTGKNKTDHRVLALGAFMGDCLTVDPDATWDFQREAVKSSVTVIGGTELRPFEVAAAWVEAHDKDDVHLEHALATQTRRPVSPRIDTTRDLRDTALSMKLAEEWLLFVGNASPVSLLEIAGAIRPLNVLSNVVFFSIESRFLPPMVLGANGEALAGGQGAAAYVRKTGEFLFLGSRKHFARAVGLFVGELTNKNAHTALDMFQSFHRPRFTIERHGEREPVVRSTRGGTTLHFHTTGGSYVLANEPSSPVRWQLVIQ